MTRRLSQDVAFSGRLNIVKALSLYDDVLEIKSEGTTASSVALPDEKVRSRLVFGKWNVDEDEVKLCRDGSRQFFKPNTLQKITPQQNGAVIRIIYKARAGNVVEMTCAPEGPGIHFSELGARGRAALLVPWSAVADLVPAVPPE